MSTEVFMVRGVLRDGGELTVGPFFSKKEAGKEMRFQRKSTGGVFTVYRHALNHDDRNPAAVLLGSLTSEKKAKAARENGKKGGRPKKRVKLD